MADRLVSALSTLGQEYEPPPGWDEHVMHAVDPPPGAVRRWWGTWRDVTNGTARVQFSSCWIVSVRGKLVSRHDSRDFAIRKAARP